MMLGEGRVLYKDIAEFKPPMIFLANHLALSVGDGSFHAIRQLERVVGATVAVLFFSIVLVSFGSVPLAATTSFIFLLYAYQNRIFEEGNITEEYALPFVLAGILCTVLSRRSRGQRAAWLTFGAGAVFAFATFAKEPFVLSAVPWYLYAVLHKGTSWRGVFRRSALFVGGALVPLVPVLTYLISHGAFVSWLDRLSWSFQYLETTSSVVMPTAGEQMSLLQKYAYGVKQFSATVLATTQLGNIAFALGVAALLLSPRLFRRYDYLPLAAVFALLADFLGATLGQRLYGHYFLQVVPSFLLLVTFGAVLSVEALQVIGSRWRAIILIALLTALFDYPAVTSYWQRFRAPFERAPTGPIAQFLGSHSEEGDSLLVQAGVHSRYYIESGIAPSTEYFLLYPLHFIDTWQSSGEAKLVRLRAELQREPPTWMILGGSSRDVADLRAFGLRDWICSRYTLMPAYEYPRNHGAFLYTRADRAAKLGLLKEPVDLREAPCTRE